MKTHSERGFTIIELTLFLAITAVLTVAVLLGSSTAIAQQRYRDSVNSLKGFIQDQYSQTANVVNSEAKNPVCSASGFVGGGQQPRGTSECLQMGRYLLIESDKVTARNVIGQMPAATKTADNDIEALESYKLFTSDEAETKEIDWGARIVKPKTTASLTASILIVRSPLSGSIITFVADGAQTPAALVSSGNMAQKDLCIDSQGGKVTSQRLAVRINARAMSPSSIEIPLERDKVCD